MGCGGSKQDDSPQGGGGASQAEIDQTLEMTGSEKHRTFRERRLSMSQQQDPAARARRMSIYGNNGGEEIVPSVVTSPCITCSCKTMGGFEPVPGGSVAKINQDRGLALWPWKGEANAGVFGVYDGHGRVGEKVSEFVIQNLPGALLEYLGEGPLGTTDPGTALSEAYIKVDESLAQSVDATVSGTTAVTAVIKDGHLWIANSGDSRAIVVRKTPKEGVLKAIDLTIDHKPDSPSEMKRILQMGGHVTPAGANGSPSRVWHNLRGLAMARSIGDHAAATVGVIAEPEITEYDLVDDDYCIVIASDGVWELLSSQNVADIIASITSGDSNEMCEKIVDESSLMWKIEEGDYRDDITVIILMTPWVTQGMRDEVAAQAS